MQSKIKFIGIHCDDCDVKDQTIANLQKQIQVLTCEVTTLQNQLKNVKESGEIIYNLLNQNSTKIDDMISQQISFDNLKQKQLSSEDIFKTSIIDDSASATLIQYLLKQTNNEKTTLNCICQRPLVENSLKKLFNQYQQSMISNQLFNNQIKELKEKYKEKYKFQCCINRFCHFFYVSKNDQESRSYCPLCLC